MDVDRSQNYWEGSERSIGTRQAPEMKDMVEDSGGPSPEMLNNIKSCEGQRWLAEVHYDLYKTKGAQSISMYWSVTI